MLIFFSSPTQGNVSGATRVSEAQHPAPQGVEPQPRPRRPQLLGKSGGLNDYYKVEQSYSCPAHAITTCRVYPSDQTASTIHTCETQKVIQILRVMTGTRRAWPFFATFFFSLFFRWQNAGQKQQEHLQGVEPRAKDRRRGSRVLPNQNET